MAAASRYRAGSRTASAGRPGNSIKAIKKTQAGSDEAAARVIKRMPAGPEENTARGIKEDADHVKN